MDVRPRFTAVLARKYGGDMAAVGLLQAQTHGNTTTAPQFHSEEWMRKQLSYLGAAATNYE